MATDGLEFGEPFRCLPFVGGGVAAEIPRLADLRLVEATLRVVLQAGEALGWLHAPHFSSHSTRCGPIPCHRRAVTVPCRHRAVTTPSTRRHHRYHAGTVPPHTWPGEPLAFSVSALSGSRAIVITKLASRLR